MSEIARVPWHTRSCPLQRTQCVLSTEKSKEIRELGWMATDGVFIYFQCFFLLGEPHEMYILFREKSQGEQLSCGFIPELFSTVQTIQWRAHSLNSRPQQYGASQLPFIWPCNFFFTWSESFPTINQCSDLWVLNQVSCFRTVIKYSHAIFSHPHGTKVL